MNDAATFPAWQPAIPHNQSWTSALLRLGIVLALILLLFTGDVRDLVTIWWSSSTFNHCLLILPIIAWLVWQRLPELRSIAPTSWLPGLLAIAAGAIGWLLGEAAGVAVARHLGIVMILQGAVITLIGREASRGLAFPIGYALLMVPFGEALVPSLQTITAKICMVMLALTGVPAHIEGVFITIPNGWFEVAEACSGVKFLIAMLAYGVLVANVCFRSWTRRILFVAAALALPVLANGLRAWGTIYVAHLTSARSAVGFDHVVYGWFFFGFVIALLMGGSWRFFDRPVGSPWMGTLRSMPVQRCGWGLTVTAVLALPSAALLWSLIAGAGVAPISPRITLPSVAGWHRIGPSEPLWRPRFSGADRMLLGHYADSAGRPVELAIAVYAYQAEGRELVGYGQGAIAPESAWAWTDNQAPPPGGRAFRITGPGGVVRSVLAFYRVGDTLTGSETRVKIETLKVKLTGGPKCAVAILVSGLERTAAEAFLHELGPVDRLADRLCAG